MKFEAAPLPGGFMLVGIFGILFGLLYLLDYSPTLGILSTALGAIFFFASVISMTKAPVEDDLLMHKDKTKKVRYLTHKQWLAEQKKQKKKTIASKKNKN